MSGSTVTEKKNAQGYVSALQRKRCGSCQSAVEVYGGTWQCRQGNFMVVEHSVCKVWEVRQPPGFKRPTG